MDETTWIGVDIGGTKTAVVLSSRPPEILGRMEFLTLPERGPEHAIAAIIRSIRGLLREHPVEASRVAGDRCQLRRAIKCTGRHHPGASESCDVD